MQEPACAARVSHYREGSGEARRPARAEPCLIVSTLPDRPSLARRSLAGPEVGQDRGARPWCSRREEGPSLLASTSFRTPGAGENHRGLPIPRTALSLGVSGLVGPEDFFFFF